MTRPQPENNKAVILAALALVSTANLDGFSNSASITLASGHTFKLSFSKGDTELTVSSPQISGGQHLDIARYYIPGTSSLQMAANVYADVTRWAFCFPDAK